MKKILLALVVIAAAAAIGNFGWGPSNFGWGVASGSKPAGFSWGGDEE